MLSWEADDEPLVWIVSPGDPLAEGLRWAGERGRRVFWVDPDLPYAKRNRDPVPDPYAAWSLGAGRYLETLTAAGWPRSDSDEAREQAMTHRLLRAVEEADGEVLALLGAAHVARVAALAAAEPPHPFSRRRKPTVELRHLDPGSLTGLLADPPLAHAAWERLREPEPMDDEAALAEAV